MSKEKRGYRDQLESILEFTNGKHLLSISDVSRYLGIHRETVKIRYGVTRDGITAESLARRLV